MGQFKLQCRLGNCGAMCSFAVRDFLDNAIKWTFPFANAQKHLLVCPGRPMLLVEDFEYSLQKKLRCSSDGWGRRGVVFVSVIAHTSNVVSETVDVPNPKNPMLGTVKSKKAVADTLLLRNAGACGLQGHHHKQ